MESKERKSNVAWGIMLLLLGLAFLAWQLFPTQVQQLFGGQFPWPLFVMIPGLAMLLIGLVTREGGMIIPGSIVTGVGSLLFYQNVSGDWGSWAYAWSIIPGFVGLGLLLASYVDPANRGERRTGAYMLAISLAVFAIFASMFSNNVNMSLIWPIVLIAVGAAFLLGAFRKNQG